MGKRATAQSRKRATAQSRKRATAQSSGGARSAYIIADALKLALPLKSVGAGFSQFVLEPADGEQKPTVQRLDQD